MQWWVSGTLYLVLGPLLQRDFGKWEKNHQRHSRQSEVFVSAVALFGTPLHYYWQMALETIFFSQASTQPGSRAMPQKCTFSLCPSFTLCLAKQEATCDEFLQELCSQRSQRRKLVCESRDEASPGYHGIMETITRHLCLDDTCPFLSAEWLSYREQQ